MENYFDKKQKKKKKKTTSKQKTQYRFQLSVTIYLLIKWTRPPYRLVLTIAHTCRSIDYNNKDAEWLFSTKKKLERRKSQRPAESIKRDYKKTDISARVLSL